MKIELPPGKLYRLEGPANLRIISGSLRVSGGLRTEGDQIVVPRLRSVPIEVLTRSLVEYQLGEEGRLEELTGVAIPEDWTKVIEKIQKSRGKVLIIGEVDVGKTFFATYVGNVLFQNGLKVAVVDGDVGQSDIGPPTTVALGIFEKPVCLLSEVPMVASYFVGNVSLANHIPEFLAGMAKLTKKGSTLADVLLINTPGWITGLGAFLQILTEELLEPDIVVGLQRTCELERILRFFPNWKVQRIPVSPHVRRRSREERAEIRRLNFAKYFENARKVRIDTNKCRILGKYGDYKLWQLGEKFHFLENLQIMKGLLVGLVDEERKLLGLGIVDGFNMREKYIEIITAVENPEKITEIRLGSIRIKPNGEEISGERYENESGTRNRI